MDEDRKHLIDFLVEAARMDVDDPELEARADEPEQGDVAELAARARELAESARPTRSPARPADDLSAESQGAEAEPAPTVKSRFVA